MKNNYIKRYFIPHEWINFQEAFMLKSEVLEDSFTSNAKIRKDICNELNKIEKQLKEDPIDVNVSSDIPEKLSEGIKKTIILLRGRQRDLIENVKYTLDDFETAQENDDRFVVLVFGEVNSGKSALANHLAGVDFDLPPEHRKAICFVEDREVIRLEESPTECTRDYQGFKSPGLLWIDCPGVLSGTVKNSNLARRLVTRADYILFVSSSDAPFKRSEMNELANLIKYSGQNCIDACMVITKADRFFRDIDEETEVETRNCEFKKPEDLNDQFKWCHEHLEKAGLTEAIKLKNPIPVSVYVARDALGRRWDNGSFHHYPSEGWKSIYESSCMTQLYSSLSKMIDETGVELKSKWPIKRVAALSAVLSDAADKSLLELAKLKQNILGLSEEFLSKKEETSETASGRASGEVRKCLVDNGINNGEKAFKRQKAQDDLSLQIKTTIDSTFRENTRSVLKRLEKRFANIIDDHVKNMSFNFDLRTHYKTHTYYSTEKSGAVGGAAGGAAGGTAGAIYGAQGGAALGTMIMPGIGTAVGTVLGGIIGGIAGGLFGKFTGKKVGQKVYKEKVTVQIPAGTNANDIIKETQKQIRETASHIVNKLFDKIDKTVFGKLITEIENLENYVNAWKQSSIKICNDYSISKNRKQKASSTRNITLHVFYDNDGKWKIQSDSQKYPSATFFTKTEAVKRARELSANKKNYKVFILNKDGSKTK